MPLTKNRFLTFLVMLLGCLAIWVAFFGFSQNNEQTLNPEKFSETYAAETPQLTITGNYATYGSFSATTVNIVNDVAIFTFTAKKDYRNHDFATTQTTDLGFSEDTDKTISENFNISMANKGSNSYQISFVYQGSVALTNTVTATYNPTTPTYSFTSTISPEGSVTINIPAGVTANKVTHGRAVSFTINATAAYSQKNSLVVKYCVANSGSYTTLTAQAGTYTIENTNVTGNIDIQVTVNLNTYTLTVPTSGTGYSATITSDGGTKLTHGKEHKFIVELQTGYTSTAPNVRYTVSGGTAQTLSRVGTSGNIYSYTIPASAVTNNISVTISATANTYSFTLSSSGTGYTASVTSGAPSNKATYGTNIVFTVTLQTIYNQTAPVVTYTVNGATTTLTGTNTTGTTYEYTISGSQILGNITTSVTATINSYKITINAPTTNPTVNIAYISGFKTITYGNVTADHNSQIRFSVVPVEGYTLAVAMSGATLSNSNGIYSATITRAATITVTATENTYTFTPPSGTGYTFTKNSGVDGTAGNYTVGHNKADISFSITLLSGYTSSTPVVSYRIGGANETTITGTKSNNTYTYTISKDAVTNHVQVFVSGVRMQSYNVTANVNSNYATFEGDSNVEHGKQYVFTLTLTAAYTKTDISSGLVTYSIGGGANTSLGGNKVQGSVATYRFTIPAEKTTGSIAITFNTTGISANTYTVTITNTRSVTVPRSTYGYNSTYYYFNSDTASNATRAGNNVTGFAFLFLMNNNNFRPYEYYGTTYYPTIQHRNSSIYYTNSFTYTHGTNVSISVRSYMDSSGDYVQENTTDPLASCEVVIKNLSTNQSINQKSTNQTATYTISNSISNDFDITIRLEVQTVNFHSPVDYNTSTDGFPPNYTTQKPLTEDEVVTKDASAGGLDISQFAGYTYTTTSPATVNSGESYTLSLTLLTAKGFSGTPTVRYWYKYRSDGTFSYSALTATSLGNNTYSISANANYTDIYISITGIQRTKYTINLPASNPSSGFTRAHVGEGTITDATQYTYATKYQFSVTVLRDNGWFCSNKNESSSDLLYRLGYPVVTYSVSGGSATTLVLTRYEQAASGDNITYYYEFTVTGTTDISISGLNVQTFSVQAVYIGQDNTEYWSAEGSVEAPEEFQGGQIVPISSTNVVYGGTFRFSVYINTADGWNGNGMIVRGRFADSATYVTLLKQSDGSYEYTGSAANEDGIVSNFVIAISGIVSDSYYISLPITNGVTFEVISASSYVLKGNDFEFSAEVRSDQGWSAGENNQDLILYYYTSATFSDDTLVGTLTGTYDSTQNKTLYIIRNIQSSLYIRYVSGLVQASFTITIESSDPSYTTSISTGESVYYGSVYEFNVNVATGYDESTLVVYYKMDGQITEFVVLTGTNGVYRTQAVVGNVTIKITPAVLLYFSSVINEPSVNGFTVSYADACDPENIPFGSNFTFYISKLASHEGTLVVTVNREGSIGNETLSPIAGTGNQYIVSNVRSNIGITVSGLSLKVFTITFSSNPGYTVDPVGKTLNNNAVTVNYGEQLQFKLSITTGYNGNAPSVVDSATATSYTPAGGIYTISDTNSENVSVGIIQSHNISISNVTLNTYSVSLPQVTTGFNIAYDSALDLSNVPYGTNFTFEIELLEGYKQGSNFYVRASIGGSAETELVASSGVYSVNNIQSNIIISVGGVEMKTFSVTMPTDDGYSLSFIEGNVSYGNSFTFSININTVDGYYEAETGVKVYYQTFNENDNKWNDDLTELVASRGIYTLSNITTNISVTISGIIKGEYQISLPTDTTGYSIVTEDGDSFTDEGLIVDYNGAFRFKIIPDRTNGYVLGENFKVSYKIANSDTDPTFITATNDVFTISPVINNLVIYVSGVEMTYYTISLPDIDARVGYTIYTNQSTSVAYKQSFTFSVNVDTQNGYDASTLRVYYQLGSQPAVEMNPISSFTYQLNTITQNYSIVIRAPSLQSFSVSLPTSSAYTIQYENETTSAYYNENFNFTLQLDTENGYTDEDMCVYYMFEGKQRQLLTANEEKVYSIPNIKSNVAVIVENVHLILYEVRLTTTAGVEYWNSIGTDKYIENPFVSYGENFEFKVILNELYNKSNITVSCNDTVLNLNAKNNYVLRNVKEICVITVEGAILNLADYTILQNAVALTPTYPESYYTTASLNSYKIAKSNANVTLNETHTQNEQYIINNTANALINALENLVLKPADYSLLNEALNQVPENLYVYTEQSRLALEAAIKNYKSDLNITQQDIVDGYVSVIKRATEGLVLSEQEIELFNESNFLLYLVGGASICIIIAMLIIMFVDHKKRTTGTAIFSKKAAKDAMGAAGNSNSNTGGNAATQNTQQTNGFNQQNWQQQQYNTQYGMQNGMPNAQQNGYNNVYGQNMQNGMPQQQNGQNFNNNKNN